MSIARSRTVIGSLYGLMRNALGLNVATPLESQELSCTVAPDRRLVVLGHEPIAGWPVDHGTVADEAAMLALHTLDSATLLAEPTFVAPGDSCLRGDDHGWRWHCIAGHGQALSDWERRPLGGALEGLATSGHTHAMSDVSGLAAALAGKWDTPANAATLSMLSSGAGALLYDGEPVGGGTEVSPIAYGDIDWGGTDYTYASDGDTNGVLYAAGVAAGGGVWTNPHTAGAVTVSAYGSSGDLASLVDRADNDAYAGNGAAIDLSYLQIDLGATRATRVNRYSLRGSSAGYNLPHTWLLLGSNDGSTWTTIDARTGDASVGQSTWGTFTPNGDTVTFFRYLRLLCHGLDSGGTYRMRAGEFEVYGRVLASTAPANPSWANTWMTDNAGNYWPAVTTG